MTNDKKKPSFDIPIPAGTKTIIIDKDADGKVTGVGFVPDIAITIGEGAGVEASGYSSNKQPDVLPCPFCGGQVDPDGWLDGNGKRGPECEECGATAESMEVWNRRASPSVANEGWKPVSEGLPPVETPVFLVNVNRWMNTGSDSLNINWMAAGWLQDFGGPSWSVIGEPRGMTLDSVTHWKLVAPQQNDSARGAIELAAKKCEEKSRFYADCGRQHPEDSESRDRCFARALAATECAACIRGLAASPQPPQQQEQSCPYCDNSGDVHRADGEWLGECTNCKQQEQSGGAHPLEGLHINHGSMDAAADAYEAEYTESQAAPQPLDEPIAYLYRDDEDNLFSSGRCFVYEKEQEFNLSAPQRFKPLYTHPKPVAQDDSELVEVLHSLEVAANTVDYCYRSRPDNFAVALSELQRQAEAARVLIASHIAKKARGEG